MFPACFPYSSPAACLAAHPGASAVFFFLHEVCLCSCKSSQRRLALRMKPLQHSTRASGVILARKQNVFPAKGTLIGNSLFNDCGSVTITGATPVGAPSGNLANPTNIKVGYGSSPRSMRAVRTAVNFGLSFSVSATEIERRDPGEMKLSFPGGYRPFAAIRNNYNAVQYSGWKYDAKLEA